VQVVVRDNNVDQALKALKKKLQREGVFREMKIRRHYEKPSERRAREAAEAVRRARKVERKRIEREGFWLLPFRGGWLQSAARGNSWSAVLHFWARAFSSQVESLGDSENATKYRFGARPVNECERGAH